MSWPHQEGYVPADATKNTRKNKNATKLADECIAYNYGVLQTVEW
jgi:hypothetical protein